MIGVAALGPGIGEVHKTFCLLENFTGNPLASVAPLKFGPRQFGQSSAAKVKVSERKAMSAMDCFISGI
jgi:hypothetical protein